MEYLHALLTVVLLVTLGTAMYIALTGGAPTVPTRKKERKAILDLAQLEDGGKKFCDLGSGTGKLLFELAERYPNANLAGVELFILPFAYSRAKKYAARKKYRNVSLVCRDMFKFNISQMDVVFTFQIPGCYEKLRRKFAAELRDDALLIIEAWGFPGIEPLKKYREKGSLPLYLYRGKQFRQ